MACRAWHDIWAGDSNSALDYARRALSINPKAGFAARVLGWCYELKGMFQEAIASFQQMGPGPGRTACVAHALARSGQGKAASDLLAGLIEDSKKKYVSPYDIAVIYTGLGDATNVLAWLDKAFAEHSGLMVYVFLDPRLKPLRTSSRFRAILRGMGFRNQSV